MKDTYDPIRRQKTPDLITAEIWNRILKGQLKPGDRLPPEKELMDQFQVSKATLREALQTLEAYGHISRKRGPQGGSVILDIVPDPGITMLVNYLKLQKYSLDSIIEFRNNLDPLIAAAAAVHITDQDIEELREHLKQHEVDFDRKKTSRRGWEFYILMAKFTKNIFYLIVEELMVRIVMEYEFSIGISDLDGSGDQLAYNTNTIEKQRRVAEAIMARKPETAAEEMKLLRTEWARLIRELTDKNKNLP